MNYHRNRSQSLLWFLLMYFFTYCFNPQLFPDTFKSVNSIVIILIVAYVLTIYRVKRIHVVYLSVFAIYASYFVIQTLASNLITSVISVVRLYLIYPSLIIIGLCVGRRINNSSKYSGILLKFIWSMGIIELLLAAYEIITSKYLINNIDIQRALSSYYGGRTLGLIRARVFTSSYLVIGDIFGILVFTSYTLYLKFKKKIYLIFSFAFFIGVFFASARGSVLGVIIALITLWLINRDHKPFKFQFKKIKWVLLIAAFVVSLIIIARNNTTFNYWFSRMSTIFDWTSSSQSNDVRLARWIKYIELWTSSAKNFLIGTGGLTAGYSSSLGVTESGLLEHLVELGLIGSLLYYFIMLYPFVRYLKSKNRSPIGNWIICSFVILFIHDIGLQISISDDICLLMWIFVMLMIIYGEIIDKRDTITRGKEKHCIE